MEAAMDVCTQMRGRNAEIGEQIEGLATEVDMKTPHENCLSARAPGIQSSRRQTHGTGGTGREVCSKRAAGSIIDLNYRRWGISGRHRHQRALEPTSIR